MAAYFFLSSWPAMCIHGDKAQAERDWVLSGESHARFKEKGSCFSVVFYVCFFLRVQSWKVSYSHCNWRSFEGTGYGLWGCEGWGREERDGERVAESLYVVDALLQLLMSICSLATGMPALNCSVAAWPIRQTQTLISTNQLRSSYVHTCMPQWPPYVHHPASILRFARVPLRREPCSLPWEVQGHSFGRPPECVSLNSCLFLS